MVQRAKQVSVKKIIKLICLTSLTILPFQFAISDPIKATRYEVKEQDTVLGIAQKLLPDPNAWPKVFFSHNETDATLHPGDVLEVIENDDKITVTKLNTESVRLSPAIRSEAVGRAIPTIPMPIIGPFLSKSRILPEEELKRAAKIIGFEGERFSVGRGSRLFVRGITSDQSLEYDVFLPGKTLQDPANNAILGIEAQIIGQARLEKQGDTSIFYLSKSFKEVDLGSYLLPSEKNTVNANFLLHYPEQQPTGHILSVLDGITQVGQYSIVTVSGGQDVGRQPGDLLAVCKQSTQIPISLRHELPAGTQYPKVKIGSVLIFRVFDKASYALVTEAKDFITVKDEIVAGVH